MIIHAENRFKKRFVYPPGTSSVGAAEGIVKEIEEHGCLALRGSERPRMMYETVEELEDE